MQYLAAFFTVLLVASASAAPNQPEQVHNPNSGEYSYGDNKQLVSPPQYFPGHSDQADFRYNPTSPQKHLVAEYFPASVVPGQPQNAPVVGNQQASVAQSVSVNQQAPVVEPNGPQVSALEQPPHHHPSVASYYAPAGLINVVSEQGVKPSSVRNFEQYGQPESASIPPNYKPFGSWGLYIGGNPADGYYTNYYKSLGASVDKQQVGDSVGVKPVSPAALSPVLRQAGSSPYVNSDYYSFAYSPSDLSSASRAVSVDSNVHPTVSHSPVVPPVSPVQAGAQVYGSPAAFESNYGVSPYADLYATKKVGAAYAQKEVKEASAPKGYQPRFYVYQPVVASPGAPLASPVVSDSVQQVQGPQQQQVVAYPVPVGSQIVGSQPGVEGSFNPYGVHGFTRYAVKPTVVSQDPSYHYGVSNPHHLPAYKQQVYQSQVGLSSYYPLSYYGYPLSQLHYSHGSVVPQQVDQSEAHHVPVQAPQVEAAGSEKSETEIKSVNNKQQKRA